MKNCLLLLIIINCTAYVFAQNAAAPDAQAGKTSPQAQSVQPRPEQTLTALAESLAASKGQRMTMELRLRNIDTVMEKIWFYDRENVDIVFDIHRWEKNPVFVRSMENAHPGILYRVVFSPENVMSQGTLEGKLESFEPVFLEKIK